MPKITWIPTWAGWRAIALGWREGVEIAEVPLALEIRDGWNRLLESSSKPTRSRVG